MGTSQNYAGPLFFAHYSFLGFDPRDKADAYANYFDQNRNHSLIQQAYCKSNLKGHEGYSERCWGLTASDDPDGYVAHEPNTDRDNGTITPTAALSSFPYTPDESMMALKHFYRELGDRAWGWMGFYDAFNQARQWWADTYLAIDQGPIILMIENHRSALLWELFMSNAEIPGMLEGIGFREMPNSTAERNGATGMKLSPNPANESFRVSFHLDEAAEVRLDIFSAGGQLVISSGSPVNLPAGENQLMLATGDLEPGFYVTTLVLNGHATRMIKTIIH